MGKVLYSVLTVLILITGFCPAQTIKAHGRPLSFTLDAPVFRKEEAVAIASQQKQPGSDIRLNILTKSALTKQAASGKRTATKSRRTAKSEKPADGVVLKDAPRKVRIAVSEGSYPFHFVDAAGNPAGMFVDLWRLWSKKTDIAVEFVPSSWGDTIKNVRSGKADIHAGIFKSAERDAYLDFGVPLHKSDTHFFYDKSLRDLNDLEDLIPFRIGIIKGDFAVDFIKKRLPGATLAIYKDNRALFDAIESGKIKVFIKDTPIALYHLSHRRLSGEFRYNKSRPIYSNMFYAAVKEGNTHLLAIIAKGMDAISAREKAEIQRKWTGVSETKTEDVLVIALQEDDLPFSGLDFEGRPTGMLVDVWKLWSKKTGQPIEFKLNNPDRLVYLLEKGEVDILGDQVPTPDLAGKMIFSQPFYKFSATFFHPSGTGAFFSRQFKQVPLGIIAEPYLADYLKQAFPDVRIRTFPDRQALIRSVLNGELQYCLANTAVTLDTLDQLGTSGQLEYDQKPVVTADIHAGLRKHHLSLLKQVNLGLSRILTSELMAIEKRWVRIEDIRQIKENVTQIRLTQDENRWLKAHPILRLGVDPNWPPIDYLDPAGKTHMGMASDFIRLLSKRLGLSMKIVPASTWDEVVEKARKKEIDVIACLTETESRKTFLDFSDPYLNFPLVIITRNDFEFISGLKDLAGKQIAIVTQYAIHDQMQAQFPNLNLSLYPSPLEGLLAVSTRKADAYVGNLVVTGYLIRKHNIANLKVAAPTGLSQGLDQFRIGVRKDWPILVRILNKGLASITEQERTIIQQKWFSIRFEHGIDAEYIKTIAIRAVLIFLAVVAIFLIWNRRLKAEINRRLKVETELKKLTLAVEQSPSSILIFNREGIIEYVNPRFTEITGFTFDEVLSETPELLVSEDIPEALRREVWNTIQSGKIWQGDLINRKRNGESFWESVLIAPVFDRDKAISHFVAVRDDITQRKESEKELLKARDEAEAANRAKSVFLSNMSHEIRTPMNAILGFSQIMLRDTTVSEDQKQNLRTIWRSGEHLLGLINNILEMSKIEAGRMTLNLESFDLYALIGDLEMMFRVRTQAKGLNLDVEYSESVPRFIKIDQGKLRQILINLVGNAVKFTEKGEVRLQVAGESQKRRLLFEISDTGPGIAEPNLEKIFHQFEQTAEARKVEGGTGLGLAISKKQALLMNGDISVTSEVNRGSTFHLQLPFEQADPAEIQSKQPQKRVLRLKPGQPLVTILVVDDQEVNRKLMVKLLTDVGFNVMEAADGQEAVDAFEANHPRLILMDVVMPKLNGVEATRKIKRLPGGQETTVFAVTASVLEDERDKILASGAVEFIRKPYREAELFSKIQQHLHLEFEFEDRRLESEIESAEALAEESQQVGNASSLTRDIIAKLPENLRQQMTQAVLNGYKKQMDDLIGTIGTLNEDTATRLKLLVQRYDYETLLKLLE